MPRRDKSQSMAAAMVVCVRFRMWRGLHDHLILEYQGLLVAACVNRAPEGTFGAAVAEVGVLDLLKVRK